MNCQLYILAFILGSKVSRFRRLAQRSKGAQQPMTRNLKDRLRDIIVAWLQKSLLCACVCVCVRVCVCVCACETSLDFDDILGHFGLTGYLRTFQRSILMI